MKQILALKKMLGIPLLLMFAATFSTSVQAGTTNMPGAGTSPDSWIECKQVLGKLITYTGLSCKKSPGIMEIKMVWVSAANFPVSGARIIVQQVKESLTRLNGDIVRHTDTKTGVQSIWKDFTLDMILSGIDVDTRQGSPPYELKLIITPTGKKTNI